MVIHEEALGINIEVVDFSEPIINEVKKNGLVYEQSNSFQLRIGYILVFYLAKNRNPI